MCNKEVSIQPYRLKNTKRFFCSKACQFSWQKSDEYCNLKKELYQNRYTEVTCCNCGEIFKKRIKLLNDKNFCNKKCYNDFLAKEITRTMTKEKIQVFCSNCGKEKRVHQSQYDLNENHFCSSECYYEWKRQNTLKGRNSPYYNRIEVKCSFCGTSMEVPLNIIKRNKNHFCSTECYYKWNMSNSKIFNPNTKPQITINNLLNDLNIEYDNEFFCKYYFIDNCLYINNDLFFIEINGTYWHTDNRKYKDIKYDLQLNGIIRDKDKQKYIKSLHKKNILYLWEIDIENNINLCKYLILEFINNFGILPNYHSFNYELQYNKLLLKNDLIIPYMDLEYKELEKFINLTS
jgi:hypothetical protein